ncbi:MAG TPA: O-antigen ligase family protein [Candidatus Aquilonibacter sp.]|nr:O-antigen ligase family protein [Candidatus Aquilonibacter sp.]
MNSNNSPAILKALIAYAICVPLAVAVGWLLASESVVSQPGGINWAWNVLILFKSHPYVWGSLILILCSPVLLRWHHLLLVASWNLGMVMYFMPGNPGLWMPMVALSLGISILYRALNSKAHFVSAPEITFPLIFMAAVVLFTAKLTGGIGLHSLGSEVMGGRYYLSILIGILGYFALTAQRIPPERAGLYVAVFFLSGFALAIGDLVNVMPSSLNFLFALFPPNSYILSGDARYAGTACMAEFCFWLMLAKYGIRGIFLSGKWWRPVVLGLSFAAVFLGGFRSLVVLCVMVFFVQFLLERMYRTKLLPAFAFVGITLVTLCIPFADKLPFAFQRSLAFLPLHIDPMAREDAMASLDWRLQIWQAVLPEVPDHLLLGKGYALSQADYQDMNGGFHSDLAQDWGSAIAGDYHNGPLSVILPLGIWGVIAVLWLGIASLRALYFNYRYGDAGLKTVNLFFLAYFIAKILMFLFIFGSLYGDFYSFIGIIGLSISLNGGIRRRAAVPVQTEAETNIPALARPRLQPF